MTADERRDRDRPDAEGPVMTILDHLNELRVHVMRAGIAIIATTIFSFIFAERLLAFLLRPYAQSRPDGATLQTLRPTEGIETYFRVALLAGIILAMPVILLELWRFIQPGLSRQERRYVYIFIPAGLGLFLLGIAFAWYVLAPTAIYFLANFMTEVFATEWTATSTSASSPGCCCGLAWAFRCPSSSISSPGWAC